MASLEVLVGADQLAVFALIVAPYQAIVFAIARLHGSQSSFDSGVYPLLPVQLVAMALIVIILVDLLQRDYGLDSEISLAGTAYAPPFTHVGRHVVRAEATSRHSRFASRALNAAGDSTLRHTASPGSCPTRMSQHARARRHSLGSFFHNFC